jgi:hypothetical protein
MAHYVRIINNKIAELDTGSPSCNIELPNELIGTHLDKWLYINSQFVEDENWTNPDLNTELPSFPN